MRAYFTVDVEPDCPPYLRGWRGVDEGMPRLLALLERHAIPATLFTTGTVARRDPARVRDWVARGHELACHGDTHVRLSRLSHAAAHEDLRRATETLKALAPVRSFRAPNLDLPTELVPALAALGYAIDSSQGRHKHLSAEVVRCGGLLRVPASTTSSLLRLPPSLVARVLLRFTEPLVLFVHPWELVDLRREKLRWDCRAGTGPPACRALDGLFSRLRDAGVTWARLGSLAPSAASA